MSSNTNSEWTEKQNKHFEDALATYNKDSPEWWQNLARAVGGKTVEEVKRHYRSLLRDIDQIENGKVPVPNYRDTTNGRRM
ncbi:hypothetical protein ABFS82_14G045400 [Erythranthe guttata]|uniref:protein RADIALIS-like 1 n=1 Tax=Erythranthe guttata TaxID=4155 RepID=UPI00064D8D75|nr:PREDICTED: protein RADIALIS-like 1 [Erythranthe guttata]|eukprot:XP_012843030.1 PREDICTED: protein RADIALIS-like 1 [Erythranthe guttata]